MKKHGKNNPKPMGNIKLFLDKEASPSSLDVAFVMYRAKGQVWEYKLNNPKHLILLAELLDEIRSAHICKGKPNFCPRCGKDWRDE